MGLRDDHHVINAVGVTDEWLHVRLGVLLPIVFPVYNEAVRVPSNHVSTTEAETDDSRSEFHLLIIKVNYSTVLHEAELFFLDNLC